MEDVLADLAAPLTYVFDPSRRIFWASILSSLVLASVAVAVQNKKWDLLTQAKRLFSKNYWFTRSSGQDVGLLFLNNGIKALLIIPLFGSHLWATIYVGRFLQSTFGDAPTFLVPGIIISLSYAIVFLLFEDGSRFFVHKAMHRVPFLWRLHRVHHSAEVLTPLTLFRVHPIESVIYFFRGLFVFGLISGIFIWLFGRELTFFHILGVDALGFIFNLAGANLRHSHVWLSFGRFEKYFISPAQHQFHHSKDHGHPNFGTYLAFWDRMNGTLKRTSFEPQPLRFGLKNDGREKSIPFVLQLTNH